MPRVTKRPRNPRKPRTRFSAEQARDAILAATETRLLEVGPQGLRLQDIARSVGLSHPTVLHHFGSREDLVAAVAKRAMQRLETDLLAVFANIGLDASRAREVTDRILERVDNALRVHGHARLLAWAVLTHLDRPKHSLLREIAVALHGVWKRWGVERAVEEAQFAVMLVSAANFGLALLDKDLYGMMGLANDEATRTRFRAWMTNVLVDQMARR